MERVVVIANPVASQFTGGSHRDVMAILSRTHEAQAVWPSSATEASAEAAKAAEDGVEIIVAMGGDGMVHHVAQGMVGTDSALAIIPAGTTNVVARLFDLPSRPIKAARLIARASYIESVGTARMVLERGTTETVHHAVFACGFGLDAEVVIKADADPYRKYRFGSIHYARTAIGVGAGSFPKRKPHMHVRTTDHYAEATTALLQFRNVYTYFGKIKLRLSQESPDPMTALILERLRRHRVPQIAYDVLTGRDLAAVGGMEVWSEVESLSLEANPPVAAQADGESLGLVDGAEVEWVPDSLHIVAG